MQDASEHHSMDQCRRATTLVSCLSVAALFAPFAAHAQDPYPGQAIAFFNATECPAGWTPTGNLADTMNGRFIVPLMPDGSTQDAVGTPLTSGEDRTHTHGFQSSFTLSDISITGPTTCGLFCNDDLTPAKTYPFKGTTAAASSEVPYVQLLVCVKSDEPTGSGTVPSGVLIATAELDCPSGWSQPEATQGRFLIGLPGGGSPLATFGGDPLTPQEDRTHSHAFSGSITTKQKQLNAAFGGEKHSGYGQSGTYTYKGPTESASTGLPYVQILQCEKD